MGGKHLLTLNITSFLIVNKYREGKLKSTLKRECKAPETYAKERESLGTVVLST